MLIEAAVLWNVNEPWSIEEVDLGDPVAGEVQIKLAASGLCHSDEHVRIGDMPSELPTIGGHEGAGVVTKVGAGVTNVAEGDHIVLAFIPACGRCKPCSTGHQNLCDLGAFLMQREAIADGTFRATARGQGLGRLCQLGTFSPYVTVHESSVVKIDSNVRLSSAALLGCGVVTGWGSAVYAARVEAGDVVLVVGVGGIGTAAVQGAKHAGASKIIVVEPVAEKRTRALSFGATHAVASLDEAQGLVSDLTWGQGADKALITVGVCDGEMIAPVMSLVSKGGRVVVTAVTPIAQTEVKLSLFELTIWQKQLVGTLFGSANPRADIPKLCQLYQDGILKLDEMITNTYELKQVNEGYADMMAGRNTRGVIIHDSSMF